MMKKILFLYILMVFNSCVHAQIYIHQVVDKSNDPTTGKIILKDHPYGCPPYTINIKGLTTGYNATRSNQNPGPNGSITFQSLEADKYQISISNSIGCEFVLEAQIRNCAGFEITMDIPITCNTNHALIHANIDLNLRTPPIKYEWINKSNNQNTYYWNNNGEHLYPGDYIIKITDDAGYGCMSMKEFSVDNFSYRIKSTISTICKEKDNCLITVTDLKDLTFPNRSFNYSWSDGINQNANSVYSRELNVRKSYKLTVTDLLTHCTETIDIAFGSRANSGEFLKENCRIFNLKHYYDANDKGSVTFIFNNSLVAPIKCQLYSRQAINEPWIPGNSYTVANSSSLLKIQWMLPGYYKLCVFDGKSECDNGCIEFRIMECDGPKNQVSIYVQDKLLPMDDPNFYVKVGVTNAGGPCKFKYYMGSDPDNSRLYILKDENTIRYFEGQTIYRSGYDFLGIQAICPCGISKTTVNVFPCNKTWKLKAIEDTITNLCYGTLPDNTICNYVLTGSVKLVIDVTKNFNQIGTAGYIKSIKWDDTGDDAQFSQNGKIITITRDFQNIGDYYLTFVDGLNCKYTHKVTITQCFNFKTKGLCTYETFCDGSYVETFKRATITLLNAQLCKARISCGGIGNYDIYGRSVKGALVSRGQNGLCTFDSYCVFDSEDEFTNTNGGLPNFKLLGKPSFKGVAYIKGSVEGPCCQDNNYFNEQSLYADVQPVDHITHGEFGLTNGIPEGPCYAIFECSDGYYLIEGSAQSPYHCKYGQDCYLNTDCIFYNIGKVNGQSIDLSSEEASLKRFRNVKKVSSTDCSPSDPDCDDIAAINNFNSRTTKNQIKFSLTPNPFQQRLEFNLQLPSQQMSYSINVYDLLGNQVYVYSGHSGLSLFESKSISTKIWLSGVYTFFLQMGSERQVVKIIKLE